MKQNLFKLRSGIEIPSIGFGPGIMGYNARPFDGKRPSIIKRAYNKFITRPKERNDFIHSIASAINNGFRLIDYSNAYGNLDLLREGIKESGIEIDDLFLTVRISNRAQFNENVRDEVLKTIEILEIDNIDLLQFHWPVEEKYLATWNEMVKFKDEGLVKVLGVANCHAHHLSEIEQTSGILPEINQVEVHPLFSQKSLLNYCRKKDIQIEAYTPIARYDDRLVRLPLLKELETKYNKTFIQIILRWHIQNGVIPVVRALNPLHQKSNLELFDFIIEEDDMKRIDSININSRLRYDPDNCDFSIL